MKKIILCFVIICCFSLSFATEAFFGLSYDTFKDGGFGVNASISAPMSKITTLSTGLEYLGGSNYYTSLNVGHTFFSFWNLNYGLSFLMSKQAINPIIEFGTGFKVSSGYSVYVGSKLELSPEIIAIPKSVTANLHNKISFDINSINLNVAYKYCFVPTTPFTELFVEAYVDTIYPNSKNKVTVKLDSNIFLPQGNEKYYFNINVGTNATIFTQKAAYDFGFKIEVFDLKQQTTYPIIISIARSF